MVRHAWTPISTCWCGAPKGASSFDLVTLASTLEEILGRQVDLAECGGLKPGADDDVRRDAVLL